MNILWLPVAGLLGAWLHEATHAVVARLVGGEVVAIDWWRLHVDFTAPTARREWFVLAAPGLVGFAALPVLWVLMDSLTAVIVVHFGWIFYTLAGGSEGEFGHPRNLM